jgi:hypothetical protein
MTKCLHESGEKFGMLLPSVGIKASICATFKQAESAVMLWMVQRKTDRRTETTANAQCRDATIFDPPPEGGRGAATSKVAVVNRMFSRREATAQELRY